MARECAIEEHQWKVRKRKPNIEECLSCKVRFPCAEKDCGHFDCIEKRYELGSKPICFYCRNPIETNQPHERFSPRTKTKAAHATCLEKAESEVRAA